MTGKKTRMTAQALLRLKEFRVSVSQMKNGRWRARYRRQGEANWTNPGITFPDQQTAYEWVWDELDRHGAGQEVEKSTSTVDDFVTGVFWNAKAGMGLDRNTLTSDRQRYENYLRPQWGHWTAERLERAQDAVAAWRGSLDNTPKVRGGGTIGPSLRNQIYWLFHQIVETMVEHGYLSRSPLPRRSGMQRALPKKRERALDHDEIVRLATASTSFRVGGARLPVGPRGEGRHGCRISPAANEVLIYTLAYGGFRISEALALRVNDVDIEAKELRIDEAQELVQGAVCYTQRLKRQRSRRRVPIPEFVMDKLSQHITSEVGDAADGNALLFPTRSDYWRRAVFNKAWKAAGMAPLKPHDLRHTAATTWWDAGYTIEEIARFLGDSIIIADEVYTHFLRGRKQGERMDELNRAILEAHSRIAHPPAPHQG